MASYETIRLEKDDGVGTIFLNRPDKLNAMNAKMSEEVRDAVCVMDNDPEVKVVVITGDGRAFCAGGDIESFADAVKQGDPEVGGIYLVPTAFNSTPLALRQMKKPTIASLNGHAVGAGCTLALCCDIRIAAEKAQIGAIFVTVGLIPEYGSTYNLSRLVGIAKACELALTGKVIGAQEAKEIGLVNQVVPLEDLETTTKQMAKSIAQWPITATQLAKRLLYQGLDNNFAAQLQFEAFGLTTCMHTEDHAEALNAFLEKRKPVFKGK